MDKMSVAKVLVVDDDAFSRHVVVSKIRQIRADVIEAENGIEALKVLQSEAFDLVITDLEMPHLDGFHLLGCIRGAPRTAHLPVIILSGHEDRASLERALSAGATSFLVKPLNWTAFRAHMTHILHLSCAGKSVNAIDAKLVASRRRGQSG